MVGDDKQITALLISFFYSAYCLVAINAQCSNVRSTDNPSDEICASLHLYKDQTYSQRIIEISQLRTDWVFAGVVSTQKVELYNCWIISNETSETFPLLDKGCMNEATYFVDRGQAGFLKFLGRFLQFAPKNVNIFRLRCNITLDCPVFSGCNVLCNRSPPHRYVVTSEVIQVSTPNTPTTGGNSNSSNSGISRDNLILIMIIIAAVFFFVFFILLLVLLCRMMKRKRRRETHSTVPVLVNSTMHPETVVQNGHATSQPATGSQDPEANRPIPPEETYASVNKKSNGVKDTTM